MGMIIAVTASKGTPQPHRGDNEVAHNSTSHRGDDAESKPQWRRIGALLLVDDGGGQYEARDGEHIHKCTGEVCHEQA